MRTGEKGSQAKQRESERAMGEDVMGGWRGALDGREARYGGESERERERIGGEGEVQMRVLKRAGRAK